MTEIIAPRRRYPWTTHLDEMEVTFRRMTAHDAEAILAFSRSLPEHDLLFLRLDITQAEAVATWIGNIEAGHTQTVLAETGGQLTGYCSLHRSDILWTRHLGEIRLLVASRFRGHGIGGELARQVFAIARGTDVHKLVAQMMSTQRDAQALFYQLGFIPEALLHDWVVDRNGRMHDLIMMSREVDDDETDDDMDGETDADRPAVPKLHEIGRPGPPWPPK